MRTRSSRRTLLVLGLAAIVLLAAAAVAAGAAYDHARRDRLAPGVVVGGVDVGGMTVAQARRRVTAAVVEPRRRTLRVHAAGHVFRLPASRLHVTADVDAALARAYADSRQGWLGARLARELAGGGLDEHVALTTHYARGVIPAFVARVAAKTDRPAREARLHPTAGGLRESPARLGRAVERSALRRALAGAVRQPARPADVVAATDPVRPKVTLTALRSRYAAYIIVDRGAHVLRFYRHLKLARTYPIAVGRAGLETPAGLYDVQWKQVNPPWIVPNSSWAGALAGKVIPPGPQDPIKARWLAFNGGAGIHGIDPSEYGSIGHDASHGCVRMTIPDVIELYRMTPVHSPVFVA